MCAFDGEATGVAVEKLQEVAVGYLLTSVEVVKDEVRLAIVAIEPGIIGAAEVEAEGCRCFVVGAAGLPESGRAPVDGNGEGAPLAGMLLEYEEASLAQCGLMTEVHQGHLLEEINERATALNEVACSDV